MRREDEKLLKDAVQAMRAGEPDGAEIAAAAGRVAARLDIDFVAGRSGLSYPSRLTLVPRPALVVAGVANWRKWQYSWALAACFALMACTLFLYKAYWQIPFGVRAEVRSVDGPAYRISNAGDRPLAPGDKLAEGEYLRTGGGAHAVLRLTDGSTVEVNEQSMLGVGARGRSMTVTLDDGSVIVQTAKRASGHLSVKTPDCRVAFADTIFSVHTGVKGSQVAVLQGSVQVSHDGIDTLIQAGGQVATNGSLGSAPVEDQIAWSHDRDKYMNLLAQLGATQNQVKQISIPSPGSASEKENKSNSSKTDPSRKKIPEMIGNGESRYSVTDHGELKVQPEGHSNQQLAVARQPDAAGLGGVAPRSTPEFNPPNSSSGAHLGKVTVAQLEQALAAARTLPDAEVARQLSGLELTERLNSSKLAQWKADMPGDKAREQLLILADAAAFLAPPAAEILADPTPAPAETRKMLTSIVNYINNTARQLPNLLAVRETIGFEDRPQQDIQMPMGILAESAMPLHFVGRSSVTVAYRDRKEVIHGKAVKVGGQFSGLATSGEFEPIIGLAVSDALHGKITWSRWEQGASGREAVFHYAVPREKSHYPVLFCCQNEGLGGDATPSASLFRELAGYHGEIVFDPVSGAILRITLDSEIPPGDLVSKASLLIEYGSVEIGGQSYICPVKSVSSLTAFYGQRTGMYAMSRYRGPSKIHLNDITFSQYSRLGTDARNVAGKSVEAGAPAGPP
jgi:ferric-dicitrate binding protein FerR (iron transport regulator)